MPNTIHTSEYRKIIQRLKQARVDAGLTQKEVAKKLKKSQSYISKIEAGEQRLDILELHVLAAIYSKDISSFYDK